MYTAAVSRRCPECSRTYEDETFFCGYDGQITIQEQEVSDFDPRLGTKLGDYVVAARVADGAMGRVYEGRHPETKQQVAIKVLHEDVAKDAVAVARFQREYEAAEEFDHPNIVTVHDFGETGDGSHFMTMEYLVGTELTGRLHELGKFKPAKMLRLISQLGSALDHAHSFGVVHRDLKPDNVFLEHTDAGDEVRILDFGSVKLQMEMGPKLTAFGTTLGSPYYMSPEQAMGKQDVDQRTDVFALSAIAWEMATGEVCYEASNVAEILMKIVNHEPPRPSGLNPEYPAEFDEAFLSGAAKDKAHRPSSAGAFADSIIRAFGLSGDHNHWKDQTVETIRAALAGTPGDADATVPMQNAVAAPGPAVAPANSSTAARNQDSGAPQPMAPAIQAPSHTPAEPASSGGSTMMFVVVAALLAIAAVAGFFVFGS